MDTCELKDLIARLQKYSEEEYNANKNQVAEDLKEAATLLQQLMTRQEKIAVDTPLGRLEACVGGDPENYPTIYTYIVRPDKVEIDLVACEVKIEEEVAQAYLYGDTKSEDWSRSHLWEKDAINIECE